MTGESPLPERRRVRTGGRSARVRAAVLDATLELLTEGGYEPMELVEVARRSGVHVTSIYRRWGTKARLVGEALAERGGPFVPTPDTGSLRTDLVRLLIEGSALLRTPPIRALFEVILSQSAKASVEVARAREGFVAAHMSEARIIVERAVARAELPAHTDPAVLAELVIGPALFRTLLQDVEIDAASAAAIVTRAQAALCSTAAPTPQKVRQPAATRRGERAR